MEDGGVDVKLYDLSEDVSEQTITDFLTNFGDVLSIRDQSWDEKYHFGGVSTGVRVARMIVKQNIPSIVTIDGEATCLSYNGQIPTCRHCSESIHNGISCIQNKKLLVQKLAADQAKPSYANVAKQLTAPKNNTASPLPSSSTAATPAATMPAANKESVIKPSVAQHPIPSTSAKTTPNVDPKALLMPPPAFPQSNKLPSTAHQEKTTHQCPHHQNSQTEGPQHNDGHESDESTSSNSSKRSHRGPLAKKIRQQAKHDTTTVTGKS